MKNPFVLLIGLGAAGLAWALSSKDSHAAAQHQPGQPKPKPKPKPKPPLPGSGIPGSSGGPVAQNPGMPPADVLARMAAALQTRDAEQIRKEAARLRKEGWILQANELEKAADLAEQVAHVPVIPPSPGPGPSMPAPTFPTVPSVPSVSLPTGGTSSPGIVPPSQASRDNRVIATQLARHLTGRKKGKEDKGLVTAYQQAEGIEADGKYGLETAQSLAKYDLVPPTPLYWGKGGTWASMQAEQKAWKAWCATKAAKDPSRSEEWKGAARIPAKQ